MKLFDPQPKLTRADVHRLTPHIANARQPLHDWLRTNPSLEDVKKAIMIETERARLQPRPLSSLGRGVFKALTRRLWQLEHTELDKRIREEIGGDK